ncbi:hypothetical protein EC912_102176 [Luteibacter rhizovicinus]|uniref:DUF1707 domain-containing protein n=1 Tax=Luteibacter rhizovicinus TaxID=242606 RepID=A0A4R3YTH4_9GAMM|nr:hypothetical protein [Luteibacter rhizovicinus]TCV95831.1 hypothetical protein EC912_102176 [Luteibacter rhizovicinus]
MTEWERHANQNLHALDEAHRLGRIGRDEYRARRRKVLASVHDSHGITARNAITPSHVAPAESPGRGSQRDALPMLFGSRSWFDRRWLMALVLTLLLLAVLTWLARGLLHGE